MHDKLIFEILKGFGLLRAGWFPSYDEVVHSLGLVQTLPPLGCRPTDIVALMQHLYTALIIHNAGKPIFRVCPDLAQMLRETDLPGDMPLELLRLPFEGIFLDIPEGTFPSRTRRLQLNRLERFRMTYTYPDPLDGTMCVSYKSVHIDPEKTLAAAIEETCANTEQAVEKTLANPSADPVTREFAVSIRGECTPKAFYQSEEFVFAINAALYITSEGADVEQDMSRARQIHNELQGLRKKAKRARLEAELKQVREHKIYICGAHLKQSREMSTEISNSLTEEGRKLMKRFRVRGHWKNQACGAGWREHKHIFVQPFWKGPTYAEMIERNYIVKNSKTNLP